MGSSAEKETKIIEELPPKEKTKDSNETPETPGEHTAMELDEFEEHKPHDEY